MTTRRFFKCTGHVQIIDVVQAVDVDDAVTHFRARHGILHDKVDVVELVQSETIKIPPLIPYIVKVRWKTQAGDWAYREIGVNHFTEEEARQMALDEVAREKPGATAIEVVYVVRVDTTASGSPTTTNVW